MYKRQVEATGAESDGIFRRDTYTGLNWSEVPSILVEMGFMTNEEEDYKLNDPAYQMCIRDSANWKRENWTWSSAPTDCWART